MRDIQTEGLVHLDSTKDVDGGGIVCNFKGTRAVKKLSLDLVSEATSVPFKQPLIVEVSISTAQMTIDDIAENGGEF